jgi:hypothetical protein
MVNARAGIDKYTICFNFNMLELHTQSACEVG